MLATRANFSKHIKTVTSLSGAFCSPYQNQQIGHRSEPLKSLWAAANRQSVGKLHPVALCWEGPGTGGTERGMWPPPGDDSVLLG